VNAPLLWFGARRLLDAVLERVNLGIYNDASAICSKLLLSMKNITHSPAVMQPIAKI
jgi:hypothetical protein